MAPRSRETMTEEERGVAARLELARGELCAVGEVDIAKTLWPLETAAACAKPGAERSTEMEALRRRVRKIIETLRLGYRSAILDSAKGYFYAIDAAEVKRCCASRHTRAMTSLVIESIIKKGQPLEDGVQMFMEFLKVNEDLARKAAERQGVKHTPIDPADVVRAVEGKAWDLIPDPKQEAS